jgi:hypothetical protein
VWHPPAYPDDVQLPLIFRSTVGLLLVVALCACGPRSDATGITGPPQSGVAPHILSFGNSRFPTPDVRIEGTVGGGDLLIFPVKFSIRADDPDRDMNRLLVSVAYTDCDGLEQVWDNLNYWLSITERVDASVQLDNVTDTEVTVPLDCYAIGGQFTFSGVIDDRGNNQSNTYIETVQINANQGSSG